MKYAYIYVLSLPSRTSVAFQNTLCLYLLLFVMHQMYTPLNDISAAKVDWNVKVRVVRAYHTTVREDPTQIFSLEYVFHDLQGNRVHATVNRANIKQFSDSIQEGRTYAIRNFIVAKNNMSFRTTVSKHLIFFCHKTIVAESLKDDLPKFSYNFKSFIDIVEPNKGEAIELFDIIGEVVGYDELRTKVLKGKETSMLDIELQDNEKNIMPCTLWGVYAEQMNGIFQSEYSKPLVMILQFYRATNFNGLRVSTAYDVTKVIVNEHVNEINEFKSRLGDGIDGGSRKISLISTSAKSVAGDIASGKVEFRSLSQLCENSEVGSFYVCAQIVTVESLSEWFYLACQKCFKKVNRVGERYYCDKCDNFDSSAQERYKLQVRVVDGTYNTSFLLWDRECVQLLGKTASLLKEDIEQRCADMDFPVEFETLVDKEILFKVQVKIENVKKNNGPYTVLQLVEDAALVSKYKKCPETPHDSDIYSKMSKANMESGKDSTYSDEVSTPLKSANHTTPKNDERSTCTLKRELLSDLSSTTSDKKLRIVIKKEDDDT